MKKHKIGKIIIYNAGFANRDESLTPTANLVCERYPHDNLRPTFRGNIILLNMDYYREHKDGTFHFTSKTREDEMYHNLNALINFAKRNPGKNIHVVTVLSGKSSVDPVYLQVKRLKFILNYLKLERKITNPLILVGHSQGGIVNMETSLTHHFMIERIISISTPYSQVTAARDFLSLVPARIAKNVVKGLAPDLKDGYKYVDSIVYLGSTDHYDQMRESWDKIKDVRPKLHVIGGISGLIESYVANLFPKTVQVTDGLVTLFEQCQIDYDTIHSFIPEELKCVLDGSEQYLKDCINCKRKCHFSTISIRNIVTKLEFNFVVNRTEVEHFIVMANHGIKGEPNTEGYYQELYDIFANDYSHASIRYYEGTIKLINHYISL